MSDPIVERPEAIDDDGERLAVLAALTADDKKAHDIVILDVGEVLSITGYFVVASASNVRLVKVVTEEIESVVKSELGRAPVRSEGLREGQWVLLDYGDVVVHVFVDELREFYDIERLYGDVARVAWMPPGAPRGSARPDDAPSD